jgi:hypothetical protein
MIPKVGPSTIAMLSGALVVILAFVETWVEGNPNVWLAAIAAGLTAAVGVLRSWQSVEATKGGDIIRSAIIGTVLGATLALVPAAANAAPCEAHTGKAKAACIHQVKRDRMAWPPNPTPAEIRRRVGSYNWNKAHRVAVCETGKRLDWYPTGRYRGPWACTGPRRTTASGPRVTGPQGHGSSTSP